MIEPVSANVARGDELNRLPSRRAFTDELKRRIAENGRKGDDLSLILLEIDQLAAVVAEHGEETAKLAQCGVVRFLSGIMREMDLLARADENSLCIMLPSCDLADASRVAERVHHAAIQPPFQTPGSEELQITLSAGIVCARPDDTEEALMARGRKVLECCRESNGNCVYVDHDGTDQDADVAAPAEEPPEMQSEPDTVTEAVL